MVVREPYAVIVLAVVKVLAQNARKVGGIVFSPLDKGGKGFILLDFPKSGVSLNPHLRISPLVAAVNFVEDWQERIVLFLSVCDVAGKLVHIVKNALAHRSRCRYHNDERLTARGGGLLHDFI